MDRYGNIFLCCKKIREICVWSNELSNSRVVLADQDMRAGPADIAYNRTTNELFVGYNKTDEMDIQYFKFHFLGNKFSDQTDDESRTSRKTLKSYEPRHMFYAICEQKRRRSVCASVQSGQRLCFAA